MQTFFGKIVIGTIKNEQAFGLIPMDISHIRFVHYPDCQQLIIWLPQPGQEYGLLRLVNTTNGKIIEECPVAERLSGSIQILWDTLPILPGNYQIEIDREHLVAHTIGFEKLEEGVHPQTILAVETDPQKNDNTAAPIQYRDGFGNVIENEDLVVREKLIKDLAKKFSRQIKYEGNFRAGTIIYSDNENRIEFYHEMGGGNCMLYIDIPTEEQWEVQTKTALSLRNEILEFVASTVRSQQAPRSRYEIKSNAIIFYNL